LFRKYHHINQLNIFIGLMLLFQFFIILHGVISRAKAAANSIDKLFPAATFLFPVGQKYNVAAALIVDTGIFVYFFVLVWQLAKPFNINLAMVHIHPILVSHLLLHVLEHFHLHGVDVFILVEVILRVVQNTQSPHQVVRAEDLPNVRLSFTRHASLIRELERVLDKNAARGR
jgi:hypothetical protein